MVYNPVNKRYQLNLLLGLGHIQAFKIITDLQTHKITQCA